MQRQENSPTPEDFDLNEADPRIIEKQQTYEGEVEDWWKQNRKDVEKSKARPLITITVIAIWALVLIATAIRSFIMGDFLMLIPPAIISVPLTIILQFYFKEDKGG